MGHLAQFNSFLSQSEVLCTQSLKYLLEDPEASSVFSKYLSEQIGRLIAPLTWEAEAYQKDGGRCDLEGSADGAPVVKIEAKLGAPLGYGQLSSYVEDLRERCANGGSLLILVPRRRANEITKAVAGTFDFIDDGPWYVGESPSCFVGLIFWEDVLAHLSTVNLESFACDFAQFQAMYRVLKGYEIKPITTVACLLNWRKTKEKEDNYVRLVDYVTRRLTQEEQEQVLPIGKEGQAPNDYRRRYVCLPLGSDCPCFSIGTRNPFKGHVTPIWMRFHRVTPCFPVIQERLLASDLSKRLVESEGHIWIPLDLEFNVDVDEQVESVVQQAEEIIGVAYRPLA